MLRRWRLTGLSARPDRAETAGTAARDERRRCLGHRLRRDRDTLCVCLFVGSQARNVRPRGDALDERLACCAPSGSKAHYLSTIYPIHHRSTDRLGLAVGSWYHSQLRPPLTAPAGSMTRVRAASPSAESSPPISETTHAIAKKKRASRANDWTPSCISPVLGPTTLQI